MSLRIAVIEVEVQIPSTEDYDEALSEVLDGIEHGIKRTSLAYRFIQDGTQRGDTTTEGNQP